MRMSWGTSVDWPISTRFILITIQRLRGDPYTIATSENGKKSAILSHRDRIFPAFQTEAYEKADWRLDNPCQAVIYEMHVRDLTISPTSGVDEAYRGTYRGLTRLGLRTPRAMLLF